MPLPTSLSGESRKEEPHALAVEGTVGTLAGEGVRDQDQAEGTALELDPRVVALGLGRLPATDDGMVHLQGGVGVA